MRSKKAIAAVVIILALLLSAMGGYTYAVRTARLECCTDEGYLIVYGADDANEYVW